MPETPKVVLITGCSKGGLGWHFCQSFAKRGCKVFAAGRRMEAMAGLEQQGCSLVQLDVCDDAACQRAIDTVLKQAGRIDILVNNAGKGMTAQMAELPIAELRRTLETNLVAPVFLSQLVIPHMTQQGGGIVINVGSGFSFGYAPYSGSYCASKWGLRVMSDVMRMELLPLNIDMMFVAPGFIATAIHDTAMDDLSITGSALGYDAFTEKVKKIYGQLTEKASSPVVFAEQVATAALRKGGPPRLLAAGSGIAWTLYFPARLLELFFCFLGGFLPRGRAIRQAGEARRKAAKTQ